jgi:predicted NAD-dependent protein-ADP-ribosyltransferase YbiA (DUF1768 family)
MYEEKTKVCEKFKGILEKKYEKKKFKEILRNTGKKILIEFSRFDGSKWGGRMKENKIEGLNWMGEIMMEIREKC